MAKEVVSAASLKRRLKGADLVDREALYLRLHRSISWIRSSEQQESIDLQFISLWIAFNSLYADSAVITGPSPEFKREKEIYSNFINKVDALNNKGDFYQFVWARFSSEVKSIIQNKFLNSNYWIALNSGTSFNESKMEVQFVKAFNYLKNQEAAPVISMILDNLYVLRNQLMHGYATHGSMVNRKQIRHGITFLQNLNTIIVLTMIEHPDEAWGGVNYPVIDKDKYFKEK